MSSTQFERLLERTEAAENRMPDNNNKCGSSILHLNHNNARLSSVSRKSSFASSITSNTNNKSPAVDASASKNHISSCSVSYLDQEARVPFDKLKQVGLRKKGLRKCLFV
jgi:hypothetical protein